MGSGAALIPPWNQTAPNRQTWKGATRRSDRGWNARPATHGTAAQALLAQAADRSQTPTEDVRRESCVRAWTQNGEKKHRFFSLFPSVAARLLGSGTACLIQRRASAAPETAQTSVHGPPCRGGPPDHPLAGECLVHLIRWVLFIGIAGLSASISAAAQDFDPRNWQKRFLGEPTRVLVLASPHLSGAPEDFDPAVLDPILDRLAHFSPEIIAVEALSGKSIDALWRYRGIYPEVATNYGGLTMTLASSVRAGLQLDTPEAEMELRRTLSAWPKQPTPANRRRLAALFVAAGDPNSALVQWWRLEPSERRAEDGVSKYMVEQMLAFDTRRNENHMIGAKLAVRLGIDRVYPIDDHASDDLIIDRQSDLIAFFGQPWFEALLANPKFAPLRHAAKALGTADEALATYRMLNSQEAGKLDADMQWLSLITRPSPNQIGRARLAEWETRNLRQVANIRAVIAQQPGARVLVITGAAHKPWFDAYLGMMSDIELVDASKILE